MKHCKMSEGNQNVHDNEKLQKCLQANLIQHHKASESKTLSGVQFRMPTLRDTIATSPF